VGWPRFFSFCSFSFFFLCSNSCFVFENGHCSQEGLGHTHNMMVCYMILKSFFLFFDLRLIHDGLRTTKYVYSYIRHSDSLRV